MNDNRINEWLKTQVEAETPDMLDRLLAELPETEQDQAPAIPMRRKKRVSYAAAAIAAAACLAIGLLGGGVWSGLRHPAGQDKAADAPAKDMAATVTFDVNPSIKMQIDEDDRVISCEAINDEGKGILKELDLTDSDVVVASYAIVGGMLTNGYLTDASNSVLVSVEAPDTVKGEELEDYLSKELNVYLEKSSIGAAIIGQYIDADPDLDDFARQHGISDGKAWIIRQLAAADPRMTEESLLKLSTQELMVLWTNRKESADGQAANTQDQSEQHKSSLYGKVSTKKYITPEQALNKALKHVGVTRDQVRDIEVDFECEKGVILYEVDFDYNGREYGIDVNAETGKIIGNTPGKTSAFKQKTTPKYDDDDYDDRYDDRYDDDDDDDDRYDDDDDDDEDD